ncbi:hypothetical protein Aduo_006343 [Ancylostoma duodenale]
MARICFTYSQAANYVAAGKAIKKEAGYDNQLKWFLLGMLFCWILMTNAPFLKAVLRRLCRALHLYDLIEEETRLGTGDPPATAHAESTSDTPPDESH